MFNIYQIRDMPLRRFVIAFVGVPSLVLLALWFIVVSLSVYILSAILRWSVDAWDAFAHCAKGLGRAWKDLD